MKRQHRPTSKEGEEFIEPHKPNHHLRIVEALKEMPVGGNFDEVSAKTGLRPDQTWKRFSELAKYGYVYDSGVQRKLSSGVSGVVWKLTDKPFPGSLTEDRRKEAELKKRVEEIKPIVTRTKKEKIVAKQDKLF